MNEIGFIVGNYGLSIGNEEIMIALSFVLAVGGV